MRRITTASTILLLSIVIGFSSGPVAGASDQFTDAIECYFCKGVYKNSTCSSPTEEDLKNETLSGITKDECKRGACVKFIKRDRQTGIMMIERTCSHRIPNFYIIMASVCRHESNGNGYLCMCGTDFCNGAGGLGPASLVTAVVAAVCAVWLWR